MGKRINVLFLDIDGVLTNFGKPEEREIKDEAMDMLVKAKERGYEAFVFITARSAPWVLENLVPKLKEHGLIQKSIIYCENGAYKIEGQRIVFSKHAESFLKIRGKLEKLIEEELKRRGINAINATKKSGKIVQIRFEPSEGTNVEELAKICRSIFNKAGISGIKIQKTKHGINIYPIGVSKGVAAREAEREILRKYGKKVRGKAFGDTLGDKEMARGKHVRWRQVNGFEDFVRIMRNLTFRHPRRR